MYFFVYTRASIYPEIFVVFLQFLAVCRYKRQNEMQLFVVCDILVTPEKFSIIRRRHHFWWMAAIFFLLMFGTHDHWAARILKRARTYDLGVSRLGFEHPNFRMRRKLYNRLCAAAAVNATVVRFKIFLYHGILRFTYKKIVMYK